MKLRSIVAPLLFCSFLQAMQREQGICYLAMLPKDAQNIIASYLPNRKRESKADFIRRTEIKSHNVSDYHRDAQQYRRSQGRISTCFSAYSPDNLKKVYLDQSDSTVSRVIAWDTVPKEDSERISLDTVATVIDADKYYYQTIDVAISSDGQWFGRLGQRTIACQGATAPPNSAQITVIHIPTNTKRDFPIPMLLKNIVFLDFNKQGTKIITHGVCFEKEEPTYFLWNLMNKEERKAQAKKSKQTLDDYFKQRGVCKKLANSLQK